MAETLRQIIYTYMKAKYDEILEGFGGAYGFANDGKITVRKMIRSSKPANKHGEHLIYVEVLLLRTDGKKTYKRLDTKTYCKASNWDLKRQEVKQRDPLAATKNLVVERLFSKVYTYTTQRREAKNTQAYGRTNDAELKQLDVLFPTKPEQRKSLVEYIDDYIIYRKSISTPQGTLKEFVSLKNRFKAFQTHSRRKYYFEDVNNTLSDNLNAYMVNVTVTKDGVTKNKYQPGTIEKTFTIFRTVLNHFNERKEELNIQLSTKFQSRSFKKGTKSVNDPHPISRPEFDILRKHKFDNSSLELTKQRFLFQCSTSMRYSDMFLLTKENIIDNCIVYYPVKTIHKKDNEVVVPLNSISEEILLSVGYNMNNLCISNQKYNASLKAMFKELNIKYDSIEFDVYRTHDGRDTFITYAIESGIDIPTLLLIVGQNSYAVMKRYFKSTPQKKIDAMNKISEFK